MTINKNLEKMLAVKVLEGMQGYVREVWKEAMEKKIVPPSHNRFYEFLKDKISASLTEMTGADIREKTLKDNQQ